MVLPMSRPPYRDAVRNSGILTILAAFDPHLAGTPPLGIALPASDLDVLCHAPDAAAFSRVVWEAFSAYPEFSLRQWTSDGRPVIASFYAFGWPFEIFGAAIPVHQQQGWRHFEIERRLLALGGEAFRAEIMEARRTNMKTEPAFAAVLGLGGNPYEALLALESRADEELAGLLRQAGYAAAD
jgi:hypothetical protein